MTDATELAGRHPAPVAPPHPRTRRQAVEHWRNLRSAVLTPRDSGAVARQLARGKLMARERVELLLDPGTFHEIRTLPTTADVPMLRGRRAHGDGVVTGWGTVGGRRVFVFSQDPTVLGGSLGETGGGKIHRLMDLALTAGAPIVGIYDGGGARIQEGIASLCAFGGIFYRNTRASGVVPQISLAMGTAVGGAVYSPALTDFVLMVEGSAAMAITGPRVVKEVTGEDVTLDQLGGAAVHALRSGVVHHVAPDEVSCLDAARRLLGFLPSSNRHCPPRAVPAAPAPGDPLAALPGDPGAPYDVRPLLATLVDAGDLFEYAPGWAPNVVCGLARLDGRPVGVVANQPAVGDGRLDVDACEKAARFLRTCDAFGLPAVTVVDCPGTVPGAGQEHRGAIRAGAKLAHAYAEATTARVHVVVGRLHGPAVVMGAARGLSDLVLAWPTAEVGAGTGGPYAAAMAGTVDEVIEPPDTRAVVAGAVAALADADRPGVPRTHENGPL